MLITQGFSDNLFIFNEGATTESIAAKFGVMAACPQHTFWVLLESEKELALAKWFFGWVDEKVLWHRENDEGNWLFDTRRPHHAWPIHYVMEWLSRNTTHLSFQENVSKTWPLPNVRLGVQVEDQDMADLRVSLLLWLPAAVRWVNYEARGPVDFKRVPLLSPSGRILISPGLFNPLVGGGRKTSTPWRIDWVSISGHRDPEGVPFNLNWARDVIRQCREAAVPVYVKQLGEAPYECDRMDLAWPAGSKSEPFPEGGGSAMRAILRDPCGADPAEWPEDLRVRETIPNPNQSKEPENELERPSF